MVRQSLIEYTLICPSCNNKVQGLALSKVSLNKDNDCYVCSFPWEKVIVKRKVSDGKKEDAVR